MSATSLMLAGLAAAYIVASLPVPAAVPLGLATLSIAVPVALREFGSLGDHDELQLRAQRRGAAAAFVLVLALAPVYVSVGGEREAFLGRSLEAAVSLFALVYLTETQGAGRGVRKLLFIAAGLSLASGLGRLPDLDKAAAMVVVAGGLAALGWFSGRRPRLAGAMIVALVILRAATAWQADLLPTTIFGLAAGAVPLRAGGNPDET